MSVFDDQYDFNCINANVPKPNALVDFRVAIEEFKRDATNIAAIYADNRKLSITQNWQLFLNQWGWVRFWASRDPDATARKDFEHILKDLDAIAQRIVDKANHLLLRHIAMLNRQ